jgi:hypothetical protein
VIDGVIVKWCSHHQRYEPLEDFNKGSAPGGKQWSCRLGQQEIAKGNVVRLEAYKHSRGCQCEACGHHYLPHILDLHHVDPDTKLKTLSVEQWTPGMSKKGGRTRKEAEKCALLCANCHRNEHYLNDRGVSLLPDDYTAPDGTKLNIQSRIKDHESDN